MVSKSRTGRGRAREIVAASAKAGRKRWSAIVLSVALGVGLGACSSTLSSLPTEVGGMPPGTPQGPVPATYPAVHDMPPPRPDVVLTKEEQKKAEDDLMALRERQEKRGSALDKANQIIKPDQIDPKDQ